MRLQGAAGPVLELLELLELALARAMLMKADIMLLDEPTNHLDVRNVKWLQDYLCGLTEVTSMIVSHDSRFLDAVCSNIIHYEGRKLRLYRGNLAEFVKQRPEAKAYYELASADLKFVLPEPGFLEGIKSKDKPILKMTHVSFQCAPPPPPPPPPPSTLQAGEAGLSCLRCSAAECVPRSVPGF